MNSKTTKAELRARIHELTKTIERLQCAPMISPIPQHKTVRRIMEVPVQSFHERIDLREVDTVRSHLKRRIATELAEELINSGVVVFKESMVRDAYRMYDLVRLEAALKVPA